MSFGVIILKFFLTCTTFEGEFVKNSLEYSIYLAVLSVKRFLAFGTLFVNIFKMVTDARSAVKSLTLKTLLRIPNHSVTHHTLKAGMEF